MFYTEFYCICIAIYIAELLLLMFPILVEILYLNHLVASLALMIQL